MSDDSQMLAKISEDYSEASLFHEVARHAFSRLGLRLVNAPHRRIRMFGGCSALYEFNSGLFLSVGLEPGDSNTLTVHFGRQWLLDGNFAALSNYYFVIARQFGIALPEYYNLSYGKEMLGTFRNVISDIETSWSRVVPGIDICVLERAEGSRFGAAQIVGYHCEAFPSAVVTIADCNVARRS